MSASTYQTISIVAFSVAALLFVLAGILFFVLNIPRIIGELSGKTALKQIKQIREQNNGVHYNQNYHNVLNSSQAAGIRKTYDSKKLPGTSEKIKKSSKLNKKTNQSMFKTNQTLPNTGDMMDIPVNSINRNVNYNSGSNETVAMSQNSPMEQSNVVSNNSNYQTGVMQDNSDLSTAVLKNNNETMTSVLQENVETPTSVLQENKEISTSVLQENEETSTAVLQENEETSTAVLQDNVDYKTGLLTDEYQDTQSNKMSEQFFRNNNSNNQSLGLSSETEQNNNEVDENATTELSQSLLEQDQKSDQAIQPLFFKQDLSNNKSKKDIKTSKTVFDETGADETTELCVDDIMVDQQSNNKQNQQQNQNKEKIKFTVVRSIVVVNSKETI